MITPLKNNNDNHLSNISSICFCFCLILYRARQKRAREVHRRHSNFNSSDWQTEKPVQLSTFAGLQPLHGWVRPARNCRSSLAHASHRLAFEARHPQTALETLLSSPIISTIHRRFALAWSQAPGRECWSTG